MEDHKPDWYEEGKRNRERALERIRELEGKYTPFLGTPDYRDLGLDSEDLREFVKGLRLLREDRDEVWSRLNKTCDDLFAKKKNQQFNRKVKSGQTKEILFTILNHAEGYASGKSPDDFRKAQDYLNEAREKMKDRDHYPLIKEHGDEVWAKLKRTQDKLRYRRLDVYASNYSVAKSAAQGAVSRARSCDKIRDGSDALKNAGEKLRNPMTKEQREEIRRILDTGWDALKQKREQQQRDWEKRQQEREQKRREWVARQHERIGRLESAKSKAESYARDLESQISDLRSKEYGARSSEYASRVVGWRYEKESKLSDVRRNIRDLEMKINDARARLK